MPFDDFEALLGWWCQSLLDQHACIADALTGKKLSSMKQCVAINVADRGNRRDIGDVHNLIESLVEEHPLRKKQCRSPIAKLLTAPPAAGKTTLISQSVILALGGSAEGNQQASAHATLVPIVYRPRASNLFLPLLTCRLTLASPHPAGRQNSTTAEATVPTP